MNWQIHWLLDIKLQPGDVVVSITNHEGTLIVVTQYGVLYYVTKCW
jgi:hypothetical protein